MHFKRRYTTPLFIKLYCSIVESLSKMLSIFRNLRALNVQMRVMRIVKLQDSHRLQKMNINRAITFTPTQPRHIR